MAIESLEKPAAKERQGARTDLNIVENFHEVDTGKTRDRVGEAVGVSGKTFR